jgi:hypothetical protein
VLRSSVCKSNAFTPKDLEEHMRNEPKHVQACEEEIVRKLSSDEEIKKYCLDHDVSEELMKKLLKEHREAVDRMRWEGNP